MKNKFSEKLEKNAQAKRNMIAALKQHESAISGLIYSLELLCEHLKINLNELHEKRNRDEK